MKGPLHVKLKLLIILILLNLLPSCASKPIGGDIIFNDYKPNYETEVDFSTPDKVRQQIKKIGNLNNPENQRKFIKVLIAFYNITRTDQQGILFPARTKTTLKFNSFCASSKKAIPTQNEIFQWVQGLPDIQLIKQIIPLINLSQLDAPTAQTLIWNLENRTHYEDYPENLKKFLNKADRNAKFILPSRLRTQIIDEILPQEIKDAKSLVTGQYYEFAAYKERIESLRSKEKLPTNYFASRIPKTPILALTTSHDFESQTITFINPENTSQRIAVSDYFLNPVRSDVQPIILASTMPPLDEIQKILEEFSLKLLGYMASQYPTLNDSEKTLVKKYPIQSAIVFYNAMIAENNAEKLYPQSGVNGKADAFRHYVWSGLITRDLNESSAREFLNAHEQNPRQPRIEKEMDEFNNELGIIAAKSLLNTGSFENEKLFQKASNEIINGNLRILNNEK
ncbi:MAG: hypothetical protein A2Z20_02560 [Bdellovibrionales bacterium RBG_16_40_8]|nr:MAG: hypothetical protein A2Z20_02560 [Bdellovibrionales bacterium RBG_16_40_8]